MGLGIVGTVASTVLACRATTKVGKIIENKKEQVEQVHTCLEDAKTVEALIAAKNGVKATSISSVGPVIGSHSGPGTLALFFVGKKR